MQVKKCILDELKGKNYQRCKFFGHEVEQWELTDWGNAIAGETGELCNIIKKIKRGDFGKYPLEENDGVNDTKQSLADELADIIIYADLLSQKAGINLREAVKEKFNKKSDKIGCKIKLEGTGVNL